MEAITSMSSRGQVVLPIALRKRLGLKEGTQFMVFSDEDNILLKPVKEPSINEFRTLLDKSRQWAESVGMTEEDITAAIAEVRKR